MPAQTRHLLKQLKSLSKTPDGQAEHNTDRIILSYGPYEAKISVKTWTFFNRNSGVMIPATHKDNSLKYHHVLTLVYKHL